MDRSSFSSYPSDSSLPKFGAGVNRTEHESDGTMRAYGEATTWVDINLDIGSLAASAGGSGPTFAALPGGTIQRPLFLNARTTEIDGAIEINHYARLVTIKPHLHLLGMDTATGDAKFYLTYTATNGGDTEPAETTISLTQTFDGTAGKNYSVGFPDIDVSALSPGCQFSFKVSRDPADAADTLSANVGLKTFGLHVEVHSLGTRDVIAD